MYFKTKKHEKAKGSVVSLVQFSMFCAIVLILGLTPLGFIPFFSLAIVTVHIPVIIGSIYFGPKKGAVLGFLFGFSSLMIAHLTPSPIAYFFSPFISGNILSLVVCMLPRILVGVFPYYVFNFLKKFIDQNLSIAIAGVVGSLTNTVLVMGFICLFFAQEYSELLGVGIDKLVITIIASISLNAIVEAIVAAIIPVAILKILLKYFNTKE